jgi:hypothetical protein
MTAQESEPGHPSVAVSASQGVQAILEAAEASAIEIRREAEVDAAAIREQARMDAGRASDSIEATLRRLQELHGELGALIASLRSGEGAAAAVSALAPPVASPPPEAPAVVPKPIVPKSAVPDSAATEDDAAGVRLIALNMALDGSPREQTAQFLAENFSLADSERLLDEVYASVEG